MSENDYTTVDGEHLGKTIPTAGTTVVFNFNETGTDTATNKYVDTTGVYHRLAITADKAIKWLGLNGTTFTDHIAIAANASRVEIKHNGIITVTIQTETDNTYISIRVL